MADIIQGPVTHVIDGDTFDMQVTHTGKFNEYDDYNQYERIRIADIDAPELGTRQGRIARDRLQKCPSRQNGSLHCTDSVTFMDELLQVLKFCDTAR